MDTIEGSEAHRVLRAHLSLIIGPSLTVDSDFWSKLTGSLAAAHGPVASGPFLDVTEALSAKGVPDEALAETVRAFVETLPANPLLSSLTRPRYRAEPARVLQRLVYASPATMAGACCC